MKRIVLMILALAVLGCSGTEGLEKSAPAYSRALERADSFDVTFVQSDSAYTRYLNPELMLSGRDTALNESNTYRFRFYREYDYPFLRNFDCTLSTDMGKLPFSLVNVPIRGDDNECEFAVTSEVNVDIVVNPKFEEE